MLSDSVWVGRGHARRRKTNGRMPRPIVVIQPVIVPTEVRNATANTTSSHAAATAILRGVNCIVRAYALTPRDAVPYCTRPNRGPQSCRTTLSKAPLTLRPPLYSMKPSLRNLFKKKFTRDLVVPTISASVSCESFGNVR
jgi:hypothetical protein